MIYKFTSANFLYPIGCLLKTRILNIRIFNLVFYTIWTLGLTLLNWIFFSNLDPLWGVHLYMSFPVGRFQWTNSTLTSLPELLEKRNIFNTRRCVVFRFTFSFFYFHQLVNALYIFCLILIFTWLNIYTDDWKLRFTQMWNV